MISYGIVENDDELHQILALQRANLPEAISSEESRSQGFVTVRHDFALLKKMNAPHPHIVARDGSRIVGYALVMLKSFEPEIPVLVPMFRQIDSIVFQDRVLGESPYFVMGQICIEKAYRGQGVFGGLYREMKQRMRPDFDFIVTEVSRRNMRSMKAHLNAGFIPIRDYRTPEDHWEVILLPCA